MKTRLIAVVVILALAIAASVVVAQGPRGGAKSAGPKAGGPMMADCGLGMGCGPGLMRDLKLSKDQTKQFKQLRDEFMAATKETREQIKAKMKGLCGLCCTENPDADAIKAQLAEIDELRVQVRNTGIDYMLRARQVLTPAQREKISAKMKNCAGKCPGFCFCCGGGCCGMGGPGMGNCPMMGGPGGGKGACPMGGPGMGGKGGCMRR